jgi:hypothetical protein
MVFLTKTLKEKNMSKLLAQFEYKVDEKMGRFLLDHDTSIAAAKEMGFAFLKYLGQIEDAAKAALAEQEAKKVDQNDQLSEVASQPQNEGSE